MKLILVIKDRSPKSLSNGGRVCLEEDLWENTRAERMEKTKTAKREKRGNKRHNKRHRWEIAHGALTLFSRGECMHMPIIFTLAFWVFRHSYPSQPVDKAKYLPEHCNYNKFSIEALPFEELLERQQESVCQIFLVSSFLASFSHQPGITSSARSLNPNIITC